MIFLALGFVNAQEKDAVSLEAPKIIGKLKMGRSVGFNDFSIKFIKVISDSRCPKNVTCVWAGKAKVLIGIFHDGEKMKEKEVEISEANQYFPLLERQNVVIKVYGLSPYPVASGKIPSKDYILNLYISRIAEKK